MVHTILYPHSSPTTNYTLRCTSPIGPCPGLRSPAGRLVPRVIMVAHQVPQWAGCPPRLPQPQWAGNRAHQASRTPHTNQLVTACVCADSYLTAFGDFVFSILAYYSGKRCVPWSANSCSVSLLSYLNFLVLQLARQIVTSRGLEAWATNCKFQGPTAWATTCFISWSRSLRVRLQHPTVRQLVRQSVINIPRSRNLGDNL